MSQESKSINVDKEIRKIETQISELHEKIIEKRPSHFRRRDIVNAFFASLLMGLMFIFKGSLLNISVKFDGAHLIAIVAFTLIILSMQIYYIGYSRVTNRKQRHFGQFWLKRIASLYIIALVVSVFMVYLFDIDSIVRNGYEILKVVIALSMPCAIGAAVPSLLKQY